MGKIWYVWLNGHKEGPFSLRELKRRTDLTPDTLAWKKGMSAWLPIRKIPELASLFPKLEPEQAVEQTPLDEDVALTISQAEPPWMLLLILILLLSAYAIYLSSRF